MWREMTALLVVSVLLIIRFATIDSLNSRLFISHTSLFTKDSSQRYSNGL
jgi:hypothetical protein